MPKKAKRKRRAQRVTHYLWRVPHKCGLDPFFTAALYAWYMVDEADDESADVHWCVVVIQGLNDLLFRAGRKKLEQEFGKLVDYGRKSKWPAMVLAALERDQEHFAAEA